MSWSLNLAHFRRFAPVARPTALVHRMGQEVAYRLRLSRVPFRPIALDIEPNNDCNLRCPHCQVSWWKKPRTHLDLQGYRRILAQFPHLMRVKLQGMGEPLLNRSLVSLLREGEARGIAMQLTTNGTVLNDALARQLATLKNTAILFSLDGATAATFEQLRVGGRFENVRANIARMTQSRGPGNRPSLAAWTTLTKQNLSEIPQILCLSNSLGLDQLILQTSVKDWGKKEMESRAAAIRATEDRHTESVLKLSQRVAQSLRLPLKIYRDDRLDRKHPCRWPWLSSYITATGDVLPCCIVGDADTHKLGNLFEQDFGQIWNGPAYRELRRRIGRHDPPHFCHSCYQFDPSFGSQQATAPSARPRFTLPEAVRTRGVQLLQQLLSPALARGAQAA